MQSRPWILADNVRVDAIPVNVSSFFSYNEDWATEPGGLLDTHNVPIRAQHSSTTPAKANLTFSGITASLLTFSTDWTQLVIVFM